ncbi:MAG: hypothetical protein EXS67_04490 [Candidatus Margulisbacteria bacterium]|nr:hypothetical protein [Candidatus Margulisiibacteriota bacterium]
MIRSTFTKIFNTTFTILLCALLIGIPLVFTPLTRSVFEVNKMLLMRLVTLFTIFLWIFKAVIEKSNTIEETDHPSGYLTLLTLKWRKTGLEWPILIWTILTIISTVFSQNVWISIIGAYDRWEGIITVTNYTLLFLMFAKLIKKESQLTWILGSLLIPTVISSVYGVFQSFGLDFMNWSVDPTARVFACINNPVHFCAYVAMTVPVSLGLTLYLTEKYKDTNNKKISYLKWAIFASTSIIYYAQFLSFSRAAWLGFVAAMTLFYLLAINYFDMRTKKTFILDFMLTSVGLGALFLAAFFKFHLKSPVHAILIFGVIIAYIFYALTISKYQEPNPKKLTLKDYVIIAFNLVVITANFFVEFTNLPIWAYLPIHILLSGYFIYACKHTLGAQRHFLTRMVIIVIFIKLQYISISLLSTGLYALLMWSFYELIFKHEPEMLHEKKQWLLAHLILFAAIILIPVIPVYYNSLFHSNVDKLRSTTNVIGRINSYEKDALKGTARSSMWKSSIPWIKDYWVIGSGLDTIKYMYPKYRRSDYGILEGGHNFTPDRLHNAYLNTLATSGVLGFLAYYVAFIGGWLFLILSGLFEKQKNPYRYLISGTASGVIIYLGQTIFNFGVVATVFLFIILMGLALALTQEKAFE